MPRPKKKWSVRRYKHKSPKWRIYRGRKDQRVYLFDKLFRGLLSPKAQAVLWYLVRRMGKKTTCWETANRIGTAISRQRRAVSTAIAELVAYKIVSASRPTTRSATVYKLIYGDDIPKEDILTVFKGYAKPRNAVGKPVPDVGPDDPQDEKSVYMAWKDMLFYKYGYRIPEYAEARKAAWYKKGRFASAARTVITYVDDNLPGRHGYKREQAIATVVGCCHIAFRSGEKAVSRYNLIIALGNVAQHVDAAFPSYAECGMLGLALVGTAPHPPNYARPNTVEGGIPENDTVFTEDDHMEECGGDPPFIRAITVPPVCTCANAQVRVSSTEENPPLLTESRFPSVMEETLGGATAPAGIAAAGSRVKRRTLRVSDTVLDGVAVAALDQEEPPPQEHHTHLDEGDSPASHEDGPPPEAFAVVPCPACGSLVHENCTKL